MVQRGLFAPCGKCNFCTSTRRGEWTFRIERELETCETARFLTLTYEDEYLTANENTGIPELNRGDFQYFMKRLRTEHTRSPIVQQEANKWPSLRYYTVGEYGTEGERPHLHSIMFNLHPRIEAKLSDIWALGHVDIGTVTQASIHYVTKYSINRLNEDGIINKHFGIRARPFALISNRSGGIGHKYLETHGFWHKEQEKNYVQTNGVIGRLPRYYKDKIFSRKQRIKFAEENTVTMQAEYWKEIDRLSKYHSNPTAYYEERIRHKHDSIKNKINQSNKF